MLNGKRGGVDEPGYWPSIFVVNVAVSQSGILVFVSRWWFEVKSDYLLHLQIQRLCSLLPVSQQYLMI